MNKAAIDEYEKRLSKAEAENVRVLMNRYQTHELLETINMLNRNLEESQRQCLDFLARPDMAYENQRLQNAL